MEKNDENHNIICLAHANTKKKKQGETYPDTATEGRLLVADKNDLTGIRNRGYSTDKL